MNKFNEINIINKHFNLNLKNYEEIKLEYAPVLLVLTILVGFNIARTTDRKKSLVNSFSAGFIGALSYQIIMGLFMILLILIHTEVGEDDATSEGEEGDFSIIEFLSTPIFHGFLASFIAIPFQEMGPFSRDRKSIQELSRQSHSHSGVIMGHTKEITELIESRDETQRKIREIRASLGDDLISLQHSTSEESNQLEISDAYDQLDGEEETTELELSDAFDQLDEED